MIKKLISSEKFKGYLFRIIAISIFWITPIINKYYLPEVWWTEVASISFFFAFLFILPFFIFKLKKWILPKISSLGKYFWISIVSSWFLTLAFLSSQKFTSASTSILFLNLAPMFALLFFSLFLRSKFSYLNKISTLRQIFLTFVLWTIWVMTLSFWKYSDISIFSNKILWDSFAFFALLMDVLSTVSIIIYTKNKKAVSWLDFVIYKVLTLFILFFPLIIYNLVDFNYSIKEILIMVFIWIFDFILAYLLSYEAYKRIDWLTNYLFFNLASIITLSLEVYFFNLPISYSLIFWWIFIISSSIFAEIISSKNEKND